jgi:hypothetical protein
MFFNLIIKVSPDAARCDQQIKAAIAVPSSEEAAQSRIQAFVDYVKSIGDAYVGAGGGKHGRPKVSSVPFFLSYFWQIQDRATWPIYFTNAVKTMGALRLWEPSDDLAASYLSFKHLHEKMAQSFTQASGKPFDLYGVEHVFWFAGEHPFQD